jgi:glycosyltransferase involved in cell wall biosynthesis
VTGEPRPRLLVVNTSRSWGGNEHWAVQVAAGMAARGAAVRMLWSWPVVGERVAEQGLEGGQLRLRGDGDLLGLLALRQEIVRHRPDALLLTRWREYLHGGLAARLVAGHRPRTVMRLGLRVVPRDDLKRRLIFRLTDRIVVNAPEIRDGLLERPWIAPHAIAVIGNGLDLSAWTARWEQSARAAGQAWRRELGIPEAAPLLLNVGALTPQKDHAGLLEALAPVCAAHPQLRVAILGEGFLREALEARRDDLGLRDVVAMPGFRRDVAEAMAAADIFVLSSENEGQARVLAEAAASGLPVVATDISGTRSIVQDGRTGRIVPPGDPRALAAAISGLLGDPGGRSRMGRAARALAEERLGSDRMLDEVAGVLFGS